MYSLIRPCLFKLDPETAHHVTLDCLKYSHLLGLTKLFPKEISNPVTVMGITFQNRIGLAAGLDNNGDYIDALSTLGFGFIEVGGVTPLPQTGNPKPRLFRLKNQEAIINRKGFCNKGVVYLANRLKQMRYQGIIGVNISKNRDTPNEKAIDDYLTCFRELQDVVSYISINVSSPNTPGLRKMQQTAFLTPLLSALKKEQTHIFKTKNKYIRLVVKISPDLTTDEIKDIAHVLIEQQMDGVIATNTTLSRVGVEQSPHANEQGGLSGKPLQARSTQVIRELHAILGDNIPIIALGGIMDEASAREKLAAGARLLQVYTGLIYQGPGLVRRLARL